MNYNYGLEVITFFIRTKKFKILKVILLFTCVLCTTFYCYKNLNLKSFNVFSKDNGEYSKTELNDRVSHIFNKRSASFVTGDLSVLPQYFDTSQKYGRWALEHEVKRIKYLNDWAYQRGMKFTDVNSTIKVKKISPSRHGIRMYLDEVYKFDYIYTSDENPVTNSFGVCLNHSLVLTKKNDNWVIYNDWYLDCFEDALKGYTADIKNINNNKSNPKPIFNLGNCPKDNHQKYTGRYNRVKAVEYANKYCGVPWGSGNNLSHNKKYKNYTGEGGDCTNYVSQVLGDKEAGGLRQDGTWRCPSLKYGNSQGSRAWVNADAFKNYLIYSGKGKIIKRGTFKKITTPVSDSPCGYAGKLELGDLICYAIGNDIDHFAVVTGWDSHGYPLINCHTVSRYHVPWDLGWGDKNISFYLIHVR